MDQADASGSDTSYDFCWNVDTVEKNISAAENLSEPKSEGSVSDFDLCDEFGVFSAPESIKSSKADSAGTNSESESDDIRSNYSVGSMGIDMFSKEVTILPRKLQSKREILFSFPVPETLYHEHMTGQEFKQMRLRDVVQEHALPFLPAKSLARFRSVSKAWDRWIKNPFLAHKQSYTFQNTSGYFHEHRNGTITYVSLSKRAYGIQNSFFNFRPQNLSIMSSCNGLLLCRTRDQNITYYVCNPAINEWKELPRPSYYHGDDPSIVLAFEPSILNMEANYHLVCAFQLLEEPVLCFEIYSSETKTWKCVDSLCAELGEAILKKNGFYYNGVVYWETTTNEVLAFDLKNEVHGVLPLLDGLPAGGALSQMNGQLSYVSAREMDIGIFEASVFKVGVGGVMELEKRVSFELGWVSGHNHCRVLPCLSDDMVMLLVDGGICAVNLITKKVEVVMTNVNLDNEAVFLPYVNSLVTVA